MKMRYLICAALLLAACGQAANEAIDVIADKSLDDIATVESSQGKLDMTTETPVAAKELPLPAFPNYPAAKTMLSADDNGVIYYPIKSPYDFSRVLSGYDDLETHTGKATLVMPKGASADKPVPAMVILHGSGGIKEGREMEYAALFAKNGIAGLVVDYYEPRGVTPDTVYQMKTMIATEVDVMSDAYSALKDIYGPCHQTLGHADTTGAPYLAIHGDADNSVDPVLCQAVYKDLEAAGTKVESHVMPGAGHAWENASPKQEFTEGSFVRGCKFSYDPKTGAFLVDGKAGRFQPTLDMTRPQRAMVRAGLGELAGSCVGQGYTVGSDPATDKKSKAIQLEFMKRVFGL